MKDLHNNVKGLFGLTVQGITTDTTTSGEIIDTKGFEGLEFVIGSGTITDGTYVFRVWQSADSGMSGATIVTTAETLGAASYAASGDDDEVRRIGSVGKLRYQQLRVVSASTSSGGTNFFAVAVQGKPHHKPVPAQSA